MRRRTILPSASRLHSTRSITSKSFGQIAGSILCPSALIQTVWPRLSDRMSNSSFTASGVEMAVGTVPIYEFFRLNRQLLTAGVTLPQASAMVSNTFSKRKAGFTYGFRALRVAPSDGATGFSGCLSML